MDLQEAQEILKSNGFLCESNQYDNPEERKTILKGLKQWEHKYNIKVYFTKIRTEVSASAYFEYYYDAKYYARTGKSLLEFDVPIHFIWNRKKGEVHFEVDTGGGIERWDRRKLDSIEDFIEYINWELENNKK